MGKKQEGWLVGVGETVEENDKRHVYKKKEDLNWDSHPLNEKVKLGFFITKKDEKVDVTILSAIVPKGAEVPEHFHEGNDILFILSGKGRIWVNGLGEFELRKDILVNVPPGIRHRIFDVTEDLEAYDVFYPAFV